MLAGRIECYCVDIYVLCMIMEYYGVGCGPLVTGPGILFHQKRGKEERKREKGSLV